MANQTWLGHSHLTLSFTHNLTVWTAVAYFDFPFIGSWEVSGGKSEGRSLAMLGGAGELYSGHWSSRDGLRLELSLVPASVSCDDIDLPAPCHSRADTKQSQVWAVAKTLKQS